MADEREFTMLSMVASIQNEDELWVAVFIHDDNGNKIIEYTFIVNSIDWDEVNPNATMIRFVSYVSQIRDDIVKTFFKRGFGTFFD